MIKIGTCCWLVGEKVLPEYKGLPVTVIALPILLSFTWLDGRREDDFVYQIHSHACRRLRWAPPQCLLPFSDPDSSVDERKPQLIEA